MNLIYRGRSRFRSDGINSLDGKYKVLSTHLDPVVTVIKVSIDQALVMKVYSIYYFYTCIYVYFYSGLICCTTGKDASARMA